jgi:hypothetical protein
VSKKDVTETFGGAGKDLSISKLCSSCLNDFSMSKTSSEAHPASYPICIGGPFPGRKARPGRDVDHSPSSIAEFKNAYKYRLSPLALV